MKCTKCNADIEQDAQFCPYCGNAVNHGRQCIKCGESLDNDSDFCPYCGAKQSNVVVEAEQVKEEIQPQKPEVSEQSHEPLSNSKQDDIENIVDDNKSSSKKWLFAIGAFLLICVLGGGGYYFLSNKNEKAGTLTVYYAKEEIKAENHGCEKGKLYYDSNDWEVRVKSDDDNFIFERDVDDYDGVGKESWSVPKSKIEMKTYKMHQLSAKEIGSKAEFVSNSGCTARIFWSNINGHKYYSWDGKEVRWDETSRHEECYVLSVEIISEEDGEKYPFEIQLDESQGHIKLYDKTSVAGQEVLIGRLEASWTNEEGWDYKKSAYSEDGKLLADQWEIDGIPDELSIAYLAEEDALYINGELYYRK